MTFYWGVATSAYQIEGRQHEDGRGPCIWDAFATWEGKTFQQEHGSLGTQHLAHMEEDIRLMKELGVKAYRFSISWPRLLPQGTGQINQKGLDTYKRLFDLLHHYSLKPFVTLYHWDLPYELFLKGGWFHPDSPSWFGEYTQLVMDHFSDAADHWMTFNEPNIFFPYGYENGYHAPGETRPFLELWTGYTHLLQAHRRSWQVIKSYGSQHRVGMAPAFTPPLLSTHQTSFQSSEEQQQLYEKTFDVHYHNRHKETFGPLFKHITWWLDPVILGAFPKGYEKLLNQFMNSEDKKKSTAFSNYFLSWFEQQWKHFPVKDLQTGLDFLGFNTYSGQLIDGTTGEAKVLENGFPHTSMGWAVTPSALYVAAKMLYQRYQTPLMVTENGMASQDWISDQNDDQHTASLSLRSEKQLIIHDDNRIQYMVSYLDGLAKAAQEGVPIEAYFYWSFMDNFEWAYAYEQRFGLVYVDYKTMKRIPKKSFYRYQAIVKETPSLHDHRASCEMDHLDEKNRC